MMPKDPLASGVWRLLEELYLESASKRTDDEYSKLSEAEKQKTLLVFANTQVTVSKRWAEIVAELRIVALVDNKPSSDASYFSSPSESPEGK